MTLREAMRIGREKAGQQTVYARSTAEDGDALVAVRSDRTFKVFRLIGKSRVEVPASEIPDVPWEPLSGVPWSER